MSIELNGSTGIDFNDGSNQSTAATPYARKNLIINGDMRIAQRGTSTSGQTTGGYTVDRFRTAFSGRDQAVWTDSQTTDVPSGEGFSNSFKVEMTTAETSMDTGTTEYFTVEHRMEGQHFQHLSYGTASAKKLTLSFWVKSSVTGTLAVSLYNVDSTRVIGSTYTINATNTWEKKTITFDGDTVGTLDNDNNQSLGLRWFLGAANGVTSADNTTWQSYVTTNFAYGHATNAIPETSGATWQITGVQLEVGDSASDFEFVPYDMELARCQRYYENFGTEDNHYFTGAVACSSSTRCRIGITYNQKRTAPTITVGNTDLTVFTGATNITSTAVVVGSAVTTKSAFLQIDVASGLTSGQSELLKTNNTSNPVQIDAEL